MADTIKNTAWMRDLAQLATYVPKDETMTSTRLDLSTASNVTDDNVDEGYYEIALDKSGGVALLCWGDTAVIPSDGAESTAGTFAVRDGDVVKAPGGTKASGILTGTGSTGKLFLTPLVT